MGRAARALAALLALTLALTLALAGCAARGGEAPPAPPPEAQSAGAAEPGAPESAPEPEAPAEPDYTDPEVCLQTFLIPYGNLIYKGEGWQGYEDLGPDSLFQFTVQKNYHIFMTRTSYADRYGPAWERIEPPVDEEGFAEYPAGEVEETALAYFGAPAEYMRTAYSYDAERNTYRFQGGGFGEEWWPKVLSAGREGDLLHIRYEVWYEGGSYEDSEGNPLEFPANRIYSALMTVKLSEGGGFQYQSVEVLPEEGGEAPQ